MVGALCGGSPAPTASRPSCPDIHPGTSRALQFLELLHLAQSFENLFGFVRIDHTKRKPHVHQHIITDRGLRRVGQAHFLQHSAKIHLAATKAEALVFNEAHDPSRHRQTHIYAPPPNAAIIAWPRAIPPSFGGTRWWVCTWNPRASSKLTVLSTK